MLHLRPIQPEDNAAVARLIKTVMTEFHCTGDGYSINDPELADMFSAYTEARSAFFVLVDSHQQIVGAGGYAPLHASGPEVCELRKMYLLPDVRGHGGGKQLLEHCLAEAGRDGFSKMYLETVAGMTTAAKLYAKYGFTPLDAPLGHTGHSACDRYMIRDLTPSAP
ncbi:putative acetyltransferase [Neolewinella xylanilytica]|uniref:Putative acetyltransferase n=1 Tax=Neolewinella xylanilytica TaxID=1514080 RepID=A0A2S6I9S9_9BACT|nr:GNAT family N-acetyltransferase [Neolewinella xylanilytica]PPK88253.1 putative acetyltransferase [Neolewinella xylanilytica]